jgi:hypothetical protein
LLGGEAVKGDVFVQAADDVVAIAPRRGAVAVEFVAVRLGEADGVEPVLRPPLAEVGRTQGTVDQSFISTRCLVV